MSYGRFLGFDGWHVAGALDVDEVLFGSAVPHRAMHEFTDIGFCGTSRRMGRSLRAGAERRLRELRSVSTAPMEHAPRPCQLAVAAARSSHRVSQESRRAGASLDGGNLRRAELTEHCPTPRLPSA